MAQNEVLYFLTGSSIDPSFTLHRSHTLLIILAETLITGPCDSEIKEKNNHIEELEKEIKRMKAQVVALEGRYVSFIPFATP